MDNFSKNVKWVIGFIIIPIVVAFISKNDITFSIKDDSNKPKIELIKEKEKKYYNDKKVQNTDNRLLKKDNSIKGEQSKDIAVFIVENYSPDWTLGSKIDKILKKRNIPVNTPSLFSDAFVKNGGFNQLYSGNLDSNLLNQLPSYFKTGILGKKNIILNESSDFKGLITATITLELHFVSSNSGAIQHSITIIQRGAGLSREDAIITAEDNLIREIESKLIFEDNLF